MSPMLGRRLPRAEVERVGVVGRALVSLGSAVFDDGEMSWYVGAPLCAWIPEGVRSVGDE